MLDLYQKGAATLATTLILLVGAASAQEHSVIIFEQAYFPAVIYVQTGDTVTFTNESGGDHSITAKDDAWSTGTIPNGTNFSIVIEQDMKPTFGGEVSNAVYIEGNLDFGSPPNN